MLVAMFQSNWQIELFTRNSCLTGAFNKGFYGLHGLVRLRASFKAPRRILVNKAIRVRVVGKQNPRWISDSYSWDASDSGITKAFPASFLKSKWDGWIEQFSGLWRTWRTRG